MTAVTAGHGRAVVVAGLAPLVEEVERFPTGRTGDLTPYRPRYRGEAFSMEETRKRMQRGREVCDHKRGLLVQGTDETPRRNQVVADYPCLIRRNRERRSRPCDVDVIVEIRAAEGGDDAKDLVREQFKLYERRARFLKTEIQVLEELPSQITFRATGSKDVFRDEAGGHRWQRVPPNEKRGRVHTSTVTVAVLPEEGQVSTVPISEIEYEVGRGSGPGGQNKNKRETRVIATHAPTGIKVVCDVEREQGQNKRLATELLKARVLEARRQERHADRSSSRKRQVGSGMRGDKRRTIRLQDGTVTDHLTGRKWDAKRYLRGEW